VEDGTKKNCGTNVDLLRYVDRRFEDFAKQMDERFRSQEVASRAAADSNARAFDKVNEFRAAMQDASERYADRGTVDVRIQAVLDRVAALEKSRYVLEGHAAEAAKSNRSALAWLGLGLLVIQIAVAIALRLLTGGS
jgi:hypothetical protein